MFTCCDLPIKGKTLKSVIRVGDASDDRIAFVEDDGTKWTMYHPQGCCESVTIDDINGELNDLVGEPILVAEKRSHNLSLDDAKIGADDGTDRDTQTWTFYTFATTKGWVTIRWYGASNGHYSEEVEFDRSPTADVVLETNPDSEAEPA